MAFTIPDLQDPKSQSYKKARQQYYKATKNRPTNCELDWSPFRAAEKRYKARFPLPDLSSVLDLALLDNARHQEVERSVWKGSLNAVHYVQLPFKTISSTPAYFIPSLPGAVDSRVITHVPQHYVVRFGDLAVFHLSRKTTPTCKVVSHQACATP